MNKFNNKYAFSIIEILIWIFIFTLGIVSVYAIISSTMRVNDLNKNYIIASNLANEQVELVKNIRDSDYENIKKYNQINPSDDNYDNVFQFWSKYKIENDYSNAATFPIKVTDITTWFEEGEDKLNSLSMNSYMLCLDENNRYTYDCSNTANKKTRFYRYISFEKLQYKEWIDVKEITDSYLLKSKVIWYIRWYHEYELKSVISDWKRL